MSVLNAPQNEATSARGRLLLPILVTALVTGAIVAVVATALFRPMPGDAVAPVVVRGTVEWISDDASVMTFESDPGEPRLVWGHSRFQGFQIRDMPTKGPDGSWHDEPVCLNGSSEGQHVTIAVARAASIGDAPGREVMVWMECPQ